MGRPGAVFCLPRNHSGMKRSKAVKHIRKQYRDALIAYVIPSLLSVYLTTGSFTAWYNSVDLRQTPHPSRSTQEAPQPTASRPVDHVALVSEIIAEDIPSHPETKSLATLIVSESYKADIDPLFVAAVVRTESRFKEKAVSPRGAKGLMQLMPETGRYVAKLSKIELKNTKALDNPETNIKLGIWYLKYLHTKFKGDREQALVAYNWGPANLRRAIAEGAAYPKESIQYVHRVNSHYANSTEKLRQYALAASETSLS